jgi:predicted PurR-regulated permease PerM
MNERRSTNSPPWGAMTKLVVALTFVAIAIWFISRFQNILGPILLAFILAYLLYPVANLLRTRVHLPWRLAVTLMYLIILIVLLGLLTLGGLAIVEQATALVNFVQGSLKSLPDFLQQLTTQRYVLGPFVIDLANLDLASITNQILGLIQPLFGTLTSLLGSLASGAANLLIWTFFILVLSFFILVEAGGAPGSLVHITIPRYEEDVNRLGHELSRIWNAFLRGQIFIFVVTVLLYIVILGTLGVHYYPGLAVMAGVAKFIPYVGPFIAWTTYGLVAFFQGTTIFNLTPLAYSLIVVGVALLVDNLFDNLISPRIMASALRVHPAAVLVAAIVGLSIFGFVGVVLASPVLATLKLFGQYAIRKLLDQDPWEGMEINPPQQLFIPDWLKGLREWLRSRFRPMRRTGGTRRQMLMSDKRRKNDL